MKIGENYEINLFKKQTTFTLDDIDIKTEIKLNIKFIDNQEDLMSAIIWLKTNPKIIGLDIETRGLDPYQHELIMLQFGDKNAQFVIDTRKVDVKGIIPLLITKTNTIIGQNLKFEYKFFKHNYGIELQTIRDTMLQEICLYNGYGLRNDLKSLAKRYLNYEADKTIRMRFLTIEDKPFSKKEIIYGAFDVILPLMIDEIQLPKLLARKQVNLLSIEHEYLKVLGDMEYKGLLLDKEKWKVLYKDNLKEYYDSIKVLDEFILTNNITRFISKQIDMFNTEARTTILWSSPKQSIELFTILDICPQAVSKHTKKMAYTVDSKVLKASLTSSNREVSKVLKEFIRNYLKMKEYQVKITTFGEKFLNNVNPISGRLHSNYRQIISTGRSSSRKPNLQNIPSDPRFRACFVSPENYKIINADFSGQENIILANKSLDKDLLEFYKKGHSDMHSFICSKIYPELANVSLQDIKAKHPSKRQIAKAAGLSINYGGTGYTIANNLGISIKLGEKVYNDYFKAFPGLKKYFDSVIEKTIKLGYVHINNVSNRRFNLQEFKQMKRYENNPLKKKEYYILKGKISRKSLNYPIQGTAGDLTKTAAIKFRKWIYKNKHEKSIFITNIVHDKLLLCINLINCWKPLKTKKLQNNLIII